MKKFFLLSIFLASCAGIEIVSQNEEQITIQSTVHGRERAFEIAEEHCNKFEKQAVPTQTIYETSIVYECR